MLIVATHLMNLFVHLLDFDVESASEIGGKFQRDK